MRNNRLSASYLKDVIDYMDKYHLTSVTVNERFKLFKNGEKLHLLDGIASCYSGNEEVIGQNKAEFIEKFKKSSFYKIDVLA